MDADDDLVRSALAAHVGHDEAHALLVKILGYVNLPHTVKGMAKRPGDTRTESAALAVVDDPALADELGLLPFADHPTAPPPTTEYFWGLLTLAARADLGVLERLDESITGQDHARKLVATIRRAANKHAVAPQADSAGAVTGGPRAPCGDDGGQSTPHDNNP